MTTKTDGPVDAETSQESTSCVGAASWRTTVPDGEAGRGRAGPFDADYVRDLIGKSEPEPEPEPEGPVTMTGSPAAMAAFIHKATRRRRKAKNDTADRKHKAAPGAAMAMVSYPIEDEADVDQGDPRGRPRQRQPWGHP